MINNERTDPDMESVCDYCGQSVPDDDVAHMGCGQYACGSCRREDPDDAYDRMRDEEDYRE